MNTTQQTVSTQSRRGFPISDLVYDVVTLMHEKAKGLEAIKEYRQDAQGHQAFQQLLDKMEQQDSQCIQELQQILGRNIKSQS